jgi:hypothetical protein
MFSDCLVWMSGPGSKGMHDAEDAEMEMVSWEEVLLNDKIRTDDAEMRAELEVRGEIPQSFCGHAPRIQRVC